MNLEQKLAVAESVRSFVSTLIWPVVLAYVATRFAPQLRDFLRHANELSLTAGGVEAVVKRQVEVAAALGMAEVKSFGNSEAVVASARAIATLVKKRVTPQSVQRISDARVLWVDDEPDNNSFARRPLEALGVRFVLSKSTEEALRATENQEFDAIISDMERLRSPGRADFARLACRAGESYCLYRLLRYIERQEV